MFGSLLGGKFPNKCKHAVKCIKARMGPIRNKKQATVRCLKKDVADLIAAGHEAIAFERIDKLIVEINHTSCYDMIEQFCEHVLSQLPSLQKQRECPQEATEAISTLIFAAARFPDLPELCDLRHVFTERYGSPMDHMQSSSVSAEFVENFQKKSFTKEKKLQLMQSIAEEFSVKWDSKTFGQQLRNAPAPESAKPKKVAYPHAGNNGASQTQAGIKEISSKVKYGSNPRSIMRRHEVDMEPKDIHVISTTKKGQSHDPTEKTQKVVACDIDKMEPYQTNNAVPPYFKPRRNRDGIRKDDEIKDGLPRGRTEKLQHELDPSLEKQEVGTVKSWNVKPVSMAPSNIKSYGDETRGHGIEKQEVGSVKSQNVKAVSMAPPYAKSNGDGYNVEETRGNCTIVPPYHELNRIKSGYRVEESNGNVAEHGQLQRHEEELDPTRLEKRSVVRPLNNNGYVIPPYHVKPKINDIPIKGDQTVQSEATDHQNERVFCDEKPRPVSVRRKFQKYPTTETNEATIYDEKPTSHAAGSQRRHEDTGTDDDKYVDEQITIRDSRLPIDEMDNAIDYGKLLPLASSGRRRHGSRHTAAVYDGQYDERFMDKLLLHYSRKGTAKEPSKGRTRSRARSMDHVDLDRVENPDNSKRETVPPPERVVSLPSERVSPVEVKMPARAASMHPDPSNPNGGRVHPKLPEYDQLPARLAAIRKT